MSDTDQDEEITEPFFAEECDVSDVKIDMIPRKTKARNEVVLIVKGERVLTLFRFYFALKDYVEKIEIGMDIQPEDDGEH